MEADVRKLENNFTKEQYKSDEITINIPRDLISRNII